MPYTFISGATGGIGKAFCLECIKGGDKLFLTGRSKQKLELLKAELFDVYPTDIECFACDLTSELDRAKMLEFIDQKGLTFNRIINVAGVDTQMPFNDYTEEKLIFQMRVNAESTICLTHALLKRRAESVEVLTVGSMSGVSPMPYFALYSATKAMLLNFFTALHYELKKEKVKVTTVLPGGVYTREDVCREIESQGLWGKVSAKTPEYVALKSLKAVRKNKVKYIPGAFNKFLNAVMKIAPKKIVLSFIAKRWKTHKKDAF